MKISLVPLAFVLGGLVSSVCAKEEEPHSLTDSHLVEVKFASGDDPLAQKSFFTLWLSEKNRGGEYSGPHGIKGGYSPVVDAHKKAAYALKLLEPLIEPEVLPDSPSRIVTVSYRDGQRWITKKFPRDNVPSEILGVLLGLGFSDEDGIALKVFRGLVWKKPNQPPEPTAPSRGGSS